MRATFGFRLPRRVRVIPVLDAGPSLFRALLTGPNFGDVCAGGFPEIIWRKYQHLPTGVEGVEIVP